MAEEFKEGDWIKTNTGVYGQIKEIELRYKNFETYVVTQYANGTSIHAVWPSYAFSKATDEEAMICKLGN